MKQYDVLIYTQLFILLMTCLTYQSYTSCKTKEPLNLSNDTCVELCEKGAVCSDKGACICAKEPGASKLGGHFTHCTNWDYVEQKSCNITCTEVGKSDHRVCWTFTIGNYCTCFDKKKLIKNHPILSLWRKGCH